MPIVEKSNTPGYPGNFRSYVAAECATFLRTSDRFGGLSNMASGYPLLIGDLEVASSEAFYQAMRFPHLPEFQQEVLTAKNALLCKRHAYTRIGETRSDWGRVRIPLMRHALALKFANNQPAITRLMLETDGRPIVEISRRDEFWGALRKGDLLQGQNILGRLLMELREKVLAHEPGSTIEISPPEIKNYRLLGLEPPSQRYMASSPIGADQPAFNF